MRASSLGNPLSLLLFLAVSLLPVYVFRSGGVQPSHLVFAVFAIGSLLVRGYRPEPWSIFLLLLSIYALIIELVYLIIGENDPKFVLNAVYLFFNFLIGQAIARYVEKYGAQPVLYGILVASTIAAISAIFAGVNLQDIGESGRETGSFNNPNQLGYFSVCLLSLAYLFYATNRIGYLVALSIFSLAIFLSILSLSKAAMIANGICVFLALKPRMTFRSFLGWSGGTIIAGAVLITLFLDGVFDRYVFAQRILNMGSESDSSLTERGYFAFQEGSFLQALFGLGSQNVIRIVSHEVHSTFGSVLNQYGFLGLFIFLGFFFAWSVILFRGFGVTGLVSLLGPATLYGVTHNGSRFTIFWLLVATSIGYVNRQKSGAAHAMTRSP